MQLKLFVLPIKSLSAPESEMNAFLRSHRVLAVKKEFVADGENSFWTFCVEYLESGTGVTGGVSLSGRPKVDYKELLKPEEFEVFSRLREWRKGLAEKEGVPVYVVFSNEQLAEMVKKRASTRAAWTRRGVAQGWERGGRQEECDGDEVVAVGGDERLRQRDQRWRR